MYSMVWYPNLHCYKTRQPCNFFQRAHESQHITHKAADWKFKLQHGADVFGGPSFPWGLPELSEAADDRVFHLTASRSNNCKSHLSESSACDWSVSTSSFKAAGHIAWNEEQGVILRRQLYVPVVVLCACVWTEMQTLQRGIIGSKSRKDALILKVILMQIPFHNAAIALLIS